MRESYKRFVKTNPSTVFKDSFCGFVLQTVFDKIWPFFTNPMNPTNPHESLLHRRTMNPHKSWGPDSRIPTVFKRFVSWIRFVLRCSKDLFCGFVLYYGVQKIRLVDSFRKTKNLKRFNSFRFGRIRVRIPHPQIIFKPTSVSVLTLFYIVKTFSKKSWFRFWFRSQSRSRHVLTVETSMPYKSSSPRHPFLQLFEIEMFYLFSWNLVNQ